MRAACPSALCVPQPARELGVSLGCIGGFPATVGEYQGLDQPRSPRWLDLLTKERRAAIAGFGEIFDCALSVALGESQASAAAKRVGQQDAGRKVSKHPGRRKQLLGLLEASLLGERHHQPWRRQPVSELAAGFQRAANLELAACQIATLVGDAEAVTAGNRRLAQALGADAGAVTSAATILRPPGTLNFKHTPPTRVRAERMQPWRRVSACALLAALPDPPTRTAGAAERRAVGDTDDDDPLRRVAPVVYVQALTGLTVGRDGKVSCPFHGPDRTPSLHVYEDPAAGWYCFGC